VTNSKKCVRERRSSGILQDAGALVEGRVAVVNSTAGEADAAASELAVGAGGTLSELLRDSVAEVAEAERVGADADNSTVSVARRAGSRRGVGRARARGRAGAGASLGARTTSRRRGWLGGSRRGGNGGSSRRGGLVRSGGLGSNRRLGNSRSAGSRSGTSSRRCARGKDTSTVGGSSSGLGRAAELSSTSAQDSDGSAVGTRNGGTRVGALTSGYTVTGVGVEEILARGNLALSRREVGDEHVGQLAEDGRDIGRGSVALRAAAGDGEGSAVHVELSVAEPVQPCPGESVLTGREALRDLDGNRGVAQVIPVVGHVGIVRATLAAVNLAVKNLPLRVLGRLGVGSDRELARATTVGRTTLKLDIQGATSRDGVHRGDSIGAGRLLAGEICGFQRRLLGARVLPVKGNGGVQDHVRGGTCGKRKEGGCLEKHGC
jgi:hypothetical protein